MIEIECPPLASRHQLYVEKKVDPASAIANEIEIGSTALDQRKARVVGLHARRGHDER